MARHDLQVPFAEKNEVKQLGARWDADKKVWYVPDGVDTAAFQRWLPEVNIRASRYYVAETSRPCWKCAEQTRVYGFLLPAGHEVLEYIYEGDPDEDSDDDVQAWLNDPESGRWTPVESPTFIHYIGYISPTVCKRAQALTRHFRIDFSRTTQSSYWMNHCEHCGMKQGDFEMHHEPHGAFFPVTEEEAKRIVIYAVDEEFEASCEINSQSIMYIGFGESNSGSGAELIKWMRQA